AQVRLAAVLAKIVSKAGKARGSAGINPRPTVTYFCNSGGEAVEGALKLSRKYTGRMKIISFEGGYHGDTMGALSACGEPRYQKPFDPLVPDVHTIPWNNPDALDYIDPDTAAVIIEPIQGEAGSRVPSSRFISALRRRCADTGALLVLDEAQTGLGRTGKWFAFEHFKVIPDILVLAKALGGGLPLGAFVSSPQIMRCLSRNPPFSHVTTFGGHPLSCAAGLASLKVLRAKRLPQKAARAGALLMAALRNLLPASQVKDIRGMGLFIGIEFHDAETAADTVTACYESGLLVGTTLFNPAVIRITPPLTVTDRLMNHGVGILASASRAAGHRT
ncbi:MAG: aspartate aminotransferase family protein, partial [bacterium]